MDINLLKKLGFNDKTAKIYLALLRLGPSSVRKLAEFCDLNRGTTYDSLKWLQDEGVVNFYNKDSKQHFVAEKPKKLLGMVKSKQDELSQTEKSLERLVPELEALHHTGGERPIARYFSKGQVGSILEDVLETCEKSGESEYRIYSAEGIREFLYKDFPTFSDVRIAKGLGVKVVAIGEGGELRGLDERRWLKAKNDTPTYIIIYSGKTAYISLDAKGEPVGVVIENAGVCETQKIIFDELWKKL